MVVASGCHQSPSLWSAVDGGATLHILAPQGARKADAVPLGVPGGGHTDAASTNGPRFAGGQHAWKLVWLNPVKSCLCSANLCRGSCRALSSSDSTQVMAASQFPVVLVMRRLMRYEKEQCYEVFLISGLHTKPGDQHRPPTTFPPWPSWMRNRNSSPTYGGSSPSGGARNDYDKAGRDGNIG